MTRRIVFLGPFSLFLTVLACWQVELASAPLPLPVKKSKAVITAANAKNIVEVGVILKDIWEVSFRRGQIALLGWEKAIEVLDEETLQQVSLIGADKKLIHFAFSVDPDTVAFCENTKQAEIRNLRTGHTITLEDGSHQPGMRFSPDGKLLATGGYSKTAKIWSVADGKLLRSLDVGDAVGGLTVEFSPDGKVLAVGNRNSATTLFDIATGNLLHTLHRNNSQGLKFGPDGKVLAITYVDGSLALWNVADGKLVKAVQPPAKELYTVDWSPNGEVLATGGLETNLVLWNAHDLTVLKEAKVDEWIIRVRFSPDGRRLLSAGGSQLPGGARMVQVWALPGDDKGRQPPNPPVPEDDPPK